MSWTDLKGDDLADVSYTKVPGNRPLFRIQREPGRNRIEVDTALAMRGQGDKVLFLRVPTTLHKRVERLVRGPKNTALVALIEQALEQVEQGSETWRVLPNS